MNKKETAKIEILTTRKSGKVKTKSIFKGNSELAVYGAAMGAANILQEIINSVDDADKDKTTKYLLSLFNTALHNSMGVESEKQQN